MADRHLPEFEIGPDDQHTAVEFHRRAADGQLVTRIRSSALSSPTARLREYVTAVLSDPEILDAIEQALGRHRERAS